MNPIKKADGLKVKNQYDEFLFDPLLSRLKKTDTKAKIVTIKATPKTWREIWAKFDFLIFLANLYSVVLLFPSIFYNPSMTKKPNKSPR